jgi:hypothetical protein
MEDIVDSRRELLNIERLISKREQLQKEVSRLEAMKRRQQNDLQGLMEMERSIEEKKKLMGIGMEELTVIRQNVHTLRVSMEDFIRCYFVKFASCTDNVRKRLNEFVRSPLATSDIFESVVNNNRRPHDILALLTAMNPSIVDGLLSVCIASTPLSSSSSSSFTSCTDKKTS